MLSRNNKLLASVASVVLGLFAIATHAQEALPSWNDGSAKQTIIAFAEDGSPDFVPPNERVDG